MILKYKSFNWLADEAAILVTKATYNKFGASRLFHFSTRSPNSICACVHSSEQHPTLLTLEYNLEITTK